jgi:hypothetical protein
MKKCILLLVTFISVMAQAQVIYKSDSVLAPNLQSRVSRKIQKLCPATTAWRLQEENTVVAHVRFDQYIEQYFTTDFSVYGTDSDGYHPRQFGLTVLTEVTHGYDHEEKDWFVVSVTIQKDPNGICQ